MRLLVICCFFLLNFFQPAQGYQDSQQDTSSWFTIRSSYFTIYYEPGVNLKRVLSRISSRGIYTRFTPKPDSLADIEDRISYRMDLILERVKEVLDIYPSVTNIQIKIFKDRKGLQDEYYGITLRSAPMKSFYVHSYNTIYTNEYDISDSVIAHEMGHAMVDHYFQVVPSEKMGEMLATYVDIHLDED
ncbi:MAG: hypothetical protein PHQ57_00495 [Candidatus Omnitrophica bacterium]|nr:hypothetical protein [Candidatus Omnitrophota bacterium]